MTFKARRGHEMSNSCKSITLVGKVDDEKWKTKCGAKEKPKNKKAKSKWVKFDLMMVEKIKQGRKGKLQPLKLNRQLKMWTAFLEHGPHSVPSNESARLICCLQKTVQDK
ncbi:hypothetical protein HAX54_040436, partial [Datura stramonium]|nr:hypothetical protein [Datura stramonium]